MANKYALIDVINELHETEVSRVKDIFADIHEDEKKAAKEDILGLRGVLETSEEKADKMLGEQKVKEDKKPDVKSPAIDLLTRNLDKGETIEEGKMPALKDLVIISENEALSFGRVIKKDVDSYKVKMSDGEVVTMSNDAFVDGFNVGTLAEHVEEFNKDYPDRNIFHWVVER